MTITRFRYRYCLDICIRDPPGVVPGDHAGSDECARC